MSFLPNSSFTFGTTIISKQSVFSLFVLYMFSLSLFTLVQLREASLKRHHNTFTNSFYKFLKVFMYFNKGLALNFAIKCNFVLWQFK